MAAAVPINQFHLTEDVVITVCVPDDSMAVSQRPGSTLWEIKSTQVAREYPLKETELIFKIPYNHIHIRITPSLNVATEAIASLTFDRTAESVRLRYPFDGSEPFIDKDEVIGVVEITGPPYMNFILQQISPSPLERPRFYHLPHGTSSTESVDE